MTGDIFKMFKTFRIHFFIVNPSYIEIFLMESTILHDHLVYEKKIF